VVAGAGGQPHLLAVLGEDEDRVPGQHVDRGLRVAVCGGVIIGGRIMHQRWSEG
jgi:hypothetical protein